jgi:hypothetical protein
MWPLGPISSFPKMKKSVFFRNNTHTRVYDSTAAPQLFATEDYTTAVSIFPIDPLQMIPCDRFEGSSICART